MNRYKLPNQGLYISVCIKEDTRRRVCISWGEDGLICSPVPVYPLCTPSPVVPPSPLAPWSGKSASSGDGAAGVIATLGPGGASRTTTPHLSYPGLYLVLRRQQPSLAQVALRPSPCFIPVGCRPPWHLAGPRATLDERKDRWLCTGLAVPSGPLRIELAGAADNVPQLSPLEVRAASSSCRICNRIWGHKSVHYTAYKTETQPLGAIKAAIEEAGCRRHGHPRERLRVGTQYGGTTF